VSICQCYCCDLPHTVAAVVGNNHDVVVHAVVAPKSSRCHRHLSSHLNDGSSIKDVRTEGRGYDPMRTKADKGRG